MPKKKTITFRHIDADLFNNYFALDSPGYFIAKESQAAGEITSPIELVELLCLANKLYAVNLQHRFMVELGPHGQDKVERCFELDHDARADYAVSILGKERVALILREVAAETREDAKIGQNDKAAPKRRL